MQATTLAAELGVSERTIARDIAILRDSLGAPVRRDASLKAHNYFLPCDHLPMAKLEPAEAFALAMGARIVGGAHEADLGDSFSSALGKLMPLLGGAVSFPLDQLNSIVTAPVAARGSELRHLETFLKAALQRRAVRLVYRGRLATAAKARIVHPLHLAQLKGRWTLIAYDPGRGAIRHFLAIRIEEQTITASFFERPKDFAAATYLQGCLGRFAGNENHEVRLALDAVAAADANETPWHDHQVLAPLPDGRLQLTVRLNNLIDVRNLVLGWGAHVEVLAPAALRAEVREVHRAALALYE